MEMGRVTFNNLTEEGTWKKLGIPIDAGANPCITEALSSFQNKIMQRMKGETIYAIPMTTSRRGYSRS